MEGPQLDLEKQKKIKDLEYIIKILNSTLDNMSVDMTGLINVQSISNRLGMADLTQKVFAEIIPKGIILTIQKSMEELGEGPDIMIRNINRFMEWFSHESRKGVDYLVGHKFPMNDFLSAASKFTLIVDELTGEYESAMYLLQDMGNEEKAEEMKKRHEDQKNNDFSPYAYWSSHLSEIHDGIQKAYSEFVEAIKDTDEFNVDFEKVCKEVIVSVDEELIKLK